MNNLQIFNYESQEVRIADIDGSPWWIAKDICDVLGIKETSDAVRTLDDDEKMKVTSTEKCK